MLGQGLAQILPHGLLKGAGVPFPCLFDGSRVSGICILCCLVMGALVPCVGMWGVGGWPGGYSCTGLGEGSFSL